jgi:hypothetical protein
MVIARHANGRPYERLHVPTDWCSFQPLSKFEWVALEALAAGKPDLCAGSEGPLTSN